MSQAELDAALGGLGEPTGPRQVPERPAILRAAVTALVLGTIVAALLLVLLELVTGHRPAAAPAGADPAPPAPVRNGNGATRPGDRAPVTPTGPPAR